MDIHHVCLKHCIECQLVGESETQDSRICKIMHQGNPHGCCPFGMDLLVTIVDGTAYFNLRRVRLFFVLGAFQWDTTDRVANLWVRMKNAYRRNPRSGGRRKDFDYIRFWSKKHVTRSIVGAGEQFLIREGELVNVLQEMYKTKADNSFILLQSVEKYGKCCGWKKRSKRKGISAFQKKVVGHKNNWKCGGCGELLPAEYEVDHAVELRDGGSNRSDNLKPLCSNCHAFKTNHRFRQRQ